MPMTHHQRALLCGAALCALHELKDKEPGYTFTFMWRKKQYWALADECGIAEHLWPDGKVTLMVFSEEPQYEPSSVVPQAKVCFTPHIASVTVWGAPE